MRSALVRVCERAPRGGLGARRGRRQAAADARPHPQVVRDGPTKWLETDAVKVGEKLDRDFRLYGH